MMKINWIEYENKKTGLVIKRATFFPELTLMIGLSGAGKTQILNAIKNMCSCAYKQSISTHFKGIMNFTIDNNNYEWEIDTDLDSSEENRINTIPLDLASIFLEFDIDESNVEIKIVYEKLCCNGEKIFERKGNIVEFSEYKKIPAINGQMSVINQFASESSLETVHSHFKNIYQFSFRNFFSDAMSVNTLSKIEPKINQLKEISDDIDEYRNKFPHSYTLATKVYILKLTNLNLYNHFFNIYHSIFDEFIDIDVCKKDNNSNQYEINFKTNRSSIYYDEMSSGMQKTFNYIFDLLTISNDYVVLIDELENSLGANCLSHVYRDLLSLRNDLQFIITSHHPYIISNVRPSQCKFIHRKENIISNYTSEQLNVENEYYDFFDSVINKLKYGEMP